MRDVVTCVYGECRIQVRIRHKYHAHSNSSRKVGTIHNAQTTDKCVNCTNNIYVTATDNVHKPRQTARTGGTSRCSTTMHNAHTITAFMKCTNASSLRTLTSCTNLDKVHKGRHQSLMHNHTRCKHYRQQRRQHHCIKATTTDNNHYYRQRALLAAPVCVAQRYTVLRLTLTA